VWWFWYIRFFDFPYQFAAVLAAIALFYYLPRLIGDRIALPIAGAIGLAVLAAAQVAWLPILSVYRSTEPSWAQTLNAGQLIGDLYRQPSNRDGVVNIPQTRPDMTYALVRYQGLDGKHIVGQLYDPFYDLASGYRYEDHPQIAAVLIQCWLSQTRTRIFVVDQGLNPNYAAFIAERSTWFSELARVPAYGWVIYQVDEPQPAAADCAAAAKAART
jgi:hypothetical protein